MRAIKLSYSFKKIAVLSFIVLLKSTCIAQVKFPISPVIKEKNDTTIYELNHSTFYSYFKQHEDSIFISFNPIKFNQIALIDNTTKNGLFFISYEKQTLVKYEIREGKISGIGLLYHPNLLGKKYKNPYCQAQFKNNLLDGITTFYNDDGVVIEILLFKKGKYKKHLYHEKAISEGDLRRGNRFSVNPFLEKEVIR